MPWTSTSSSCRLTTSALVIAAGTGFLIYSTYVTNNLQVVGEKWISDTYEKDNNGTTPTAEYVTMQWAWLIAAKEIGKILGTLILPTIAERSGRRSGLVMNNCVVMIGCVLCYAGQYSSIHLIMIGRMLLGISMICGVGLASLFLIEIAPIDKRGWTGSLIQVFRGLGGTAGMALALPQVMGNRQWWGVCMAIPILPAFLQFVGLMFCPESPRHLFITDGDVRAATKSIRFYQGAVNAEKCLTDLEHEKAVISDITNGKENFLSVFRQRANWTPLLLTTLALTNRSLAGILLVQSFSTDLFVVAGVAHNVAALSTVLLGIAHFISAIAVSCVINRCNRRTMLISSNIICAITLVAVAICAHNQLAPRLTIVSLVIFMLVYPCLASVSNIVASEICHQKLRSTAFTIGLLSYSIVGFLSTFAYPYLKHHFGVSASFAPFVISLCIVSAVFYKYLPETRAQTFDQAFKAESKMSKTTPHGTYTQLSGVGFDVEHETQNAELSEDRTVLSDDSGLATNEC